MGGDVLNTFWENMTSIKYYHIMSWCMKQFIICFTSFSVTAIAIWWFLLLSPKVCLRCWRLRSLHSSRLHCFSPIPSYCSDGLRPFNVLCRTFFQAVLISNLSSTISKVLLDDLLTLSKIKIKNKKFKVIALLLV